MAHIVFILGDYYPSPAANGYCTSKIINELAKNNKISVICYQENGVNSYLKNNGIEIYTVINLRNKFRESINIKKTTSKGNSKKIYSYAEQAMRVNRALISIFSWPTSESWFIKKALKILEKLHEVDAVVTVSSPFEAHIVGKIYKERNKNVKWLTYTLDQFSDHNAIHKYKFFKKRSLEKNIKIEREINTSSNMNFITPSRENWCSEILKLSKKEYTVISFPLMDKLGVDSESSFTLNSEKINIVFAGTLYRDIRNPEYLLEMFSSIKNKKMELHFFSKGDCSKLIDNYRLKLPENIFNHEAVSIKEIHKILSHSDILINLGNNIANQLPSKLYEYMSAGKPIINMHYPNLDYEEILSKYPSYLQIAQNEEDFENNKKKFEDFCLAKAGKKFSYKHIKSLYEESTPEYIANQFNKYL